jgi:hypothetical protein
MFSCQASLLPQEKQWEGGQKRLIFSPSIILGRREAAMLRKLPTTAPARKAMNMASGNSGNDPAHLEDRQEHGHGDAA